MIYYPVYSNFHIFRCGGRYECMKFLIFSRLWDTKGIELSLFGSSFTSYHDFTISLFRRGGGGGEGGEGGGGGGGGGGDYVCVCLSVYHYTSFSSIFKVLPLGPINNPTKFVCGYSS